MYGPGYHRFVLIAKYVWNSDKWEVGQATWKPQCMAGIHFDGWYTVQVLNWEAKKLLFDICLFGLNSSS